MDTLPVTYSLSRLLSLHGTAAAPLLVDVRRPEAFASANYLIAGATWRAPNAVGDWARYLPRHRTIVVYCVHGYEISKNTASALLAEGFNAATLEGGIDAWTQAGGPTGFKSASIPSRPNHPTRWITRERPKVDRIACPWLIRRFIDPFAEFIYVPAHEVLTQADSLGATPYDVPGVRYTHRGERCSFDAFIADHGLAHPALDRLADIVRGADTDRPDLAPEAAGLHAISLGLSATLENDHAMLAAGMTLYDALYACCRTEASGQGVRHNWTYAQ